MGLFGWLWGLFRLFRKKKVYPNTSKALEPKNEKPKSKPKPKPKKPAVKGQKGKSRIKNNKRVYRK